MRKNILVWLCCFFLLFGLQAKGWGAGTSAGFSISGAVRQSIRLTPEDLNRFQSMGFTAWFNAAILDDSHIVTLLSTKG